MAVEDDNESIKIDPKCLIAYHKRGCCKYRLGDLDGMQKDLRKVLEIDPDFAKSIKKLQYTKRNLRSY